jgi:hypothetical protein
MHRECAQAENITNFGAFISSPVDEMLSFTRYTPLIKKLIIENNQGVTLVCT